MRTGSVVVEGEAMNTVMVTSSNDVMKARTQPDTTPGRISGSVTRRNSVTGLAPSEIAACSMARSMPVEADGGEEAQERDAEHHMRDHQRRHEEGEDRLAAGEAIARDRQRGRHRE